MLDGPHHHGEHPQGAGKGVHPTSALLPDRTSLLGKAGGSVFPAPEIKSEPKT